jgi:putative ATP-dependent endonuclease of OLD family
MLVRAVRLANFRAYRKEITTRLEPLTAFVGKNDVGKSTIFDALAIFFDAAKIEEKDRCVHVPNDATVSITCVFGRLPDHIIVDDSAKTTLGDEFLLNKDGYLEIRKTYSGDKLREEVFAVCEHPSATAAKDLLTLKNADLKARASSTNGGGSDKRNNVDLRRAVRSSVGDLILETAQVPLAKEGGKQLWAALEHHLPFFAVFRADRPSTDEDAEIQDPMKIAVRHALRELQPELDHIQRRVEESAKRTAEKTLEKLAALDERIAATLTPRYKSEPKWETIFKLALDGENDIPINKRGSGVRRLILLSFFQAEVERQQAERQRRDVLYAIEEPETSQHPSNQVLLVESLKELSTSEGCQVLLTTHVPALAGMLPITGIRHVTQSADAARAIDHGDQILKAIATDLGVLPDYHDPRCKMIVSVEGPTDVEFFRNISSAVLELDPTMPDLRTDVRVAILPAGGDTLKDWITKRYLKDLCLPEVHIYDKDVAKYGDYCAQVNARNDGLGSWAAQTGRREIENYYPEKLVNQHFSIGISITPTTDVENEIRLALGNKKQFKNKSIKRNLAEFVAPLIRGEDLKDQGDDAEILGWFARIRAHVASTK